MHLSSLRSVALGATAIAIALTGATTVTNHGAAQAAETLTPAPSSPADHSKPAHLPNPTVPQRYLDQKVNWQLCSFDAMFKRMIPGINDTMCANITVPMDWQNPDAHPDITLAVVFTKASGTSQGVLTTNPGGPGSGGRTLTHSLAIGKKSLASDFDMLGFDPRGYGNSTNLRCTTTQEELDAVPTTTDPRVPDKDTFAAQEAKARLLAKACASDELAPFVSTQQTVYDMDFLRTLVKADKLHYAGYSYGTWLGAWYADTYPEHTGRFLLDSNMEWTTTMEKAFDLQPQGFQRRRDEMLFPWIARHDADYHMGTTAQAVKRYYETVRAKISANAKKGYTYPGPEALDNEVGVWIYTDAGFPMAAARMAAYAQYADNPDGGVPQGPWRLATHPLVKALPKVTDPDTALARAMSDDDPAEPAEVNLGALDLAIKCNDSTWPSDRMHYVDNWVNKSRLYPFLGYRYGINACAYWPYHRDADRVIDLPGAPQMLMVQSEGDPATEYSGAKRAHAATPQTTRLVSVDDEGQHGIWGSIPVPCVDRTGDDFLFRGKLPAADQVCGTVPLPDDTKVHPLNAYVSGVQHQQTAADESRQVVSAILARAHGAG